MTYLFFLINKSVWLAHYLSLITFTKFHIKLCFYYFFLLWQSYLNPCSRMEKYFFLSCISLLHFFCCCIVKWVCWGHLTQVNHTQTFHEAWNVSLKIVLLVGHFSILKRLFHIKVQTGTHFWNDFFVFCKTTPPPKKKLHSIKGIFQIYF